MLMRMGKLVKEDGHSLSLRYKINKRYNNQKILLNNTIKTSINHI